jgi:hypothetical protein
MKLFKLDPRFSIEEISNGGYAEMPLQQRDNFISGLRRAGL